MAENQILPFAQGQGANVLSQADYAGDSMRLQGHQPGVARSALENKALRQATAMAAGLAQFIVDKAAQDVTDEKTAAEISTALAQACAESALSNFVVNVGTGRLALNIPGVALIQSGFAEGSTGTITFPIAAPDARITNVLMSSGMSGGTYAPYVPAVTAITSTGFTYLNRNKNGGQDHMNFYWLSISVR